MVLHHTPEMDICMFNPGLAKVYGMEMGWD